jgi:microsomal dipeptidase-like Zn-dependent dipeptidase
MCKENNLPEQNIDVTRNEALRAPVADMANHLDYLVNLISIEHVGLGGDVNGKHITLAKAQKARKS